MTGVHVYIGGQTLDGEKAFDKYHQCRGPVNYPVYRWRHKPREMKYLTQDHTARGLPSLRDLACPGVIRDLAQHLWEFLVTWKRGPLLNPISKDKGHSHFACVREPRMVLLAQFCGNLRGSSISNKRPNVLRLYLEYLGVGQFPKESFFFFFFSRTVRLAGS